MPAVFAGLALADLIAVVGALVIVGMYYMSRAWLHPLVVAMMHPHTALWKRVLTAPVRYVLGPAAKFAVTYAERLLAWNVHAVLMPVVHWFHSLASVVGELADLVTDFPGEVHFALYYLRHVAVPSLIHAAVGPVHALATEAKTLAADLRAEADSIAGAVAASLDSIGWVTSLDFFGAIRNLAHALVHLWTYVYGEVTAKIGSLEREATRLQHGIDDFGTRLGDLISGKIARLEDAVQGLLNTVDLELAPFIAALRAGIVPLALMAAITAALAAVWDGIFCRNTNAVGKTLCGLDSNLLGAFLADVTGVLELAGIVELTRELQGVVGETASAIKTLAEV